MNGPKKDVANTETKAAAWSHTLWRRHFFGLVLTLSLDLVRTSDSHWPYSE
jgi:hypothetical protein